MTTVEKTFTIKADRETMLKFERFLALLHYNSRFGHSALFGMFMDGDGPDGFTCSPAPGFQHEVGLIGGVGDGVEVARPNGYGFVRTKREGAEWETRPSSTLYKNGERHKSYPSTLTD